MKNQTYKYSEIFHSFQGEGYYTGRSTAWIRFATCNLQCDGMGQIDPTNPSTYILPYKEFDLSSITSIEELPVWKYGCDSSYTWSARYKHLFKADNAKDICDKIQDVLKHPSNPHGMFRHPHTQQETHMAFTGGEPMLNQEAMLAIIEEFGERGNFPYNITVETNGTKPFNNTELSQFIKDYVLRYEQIGREWFWSVSPKLWSTAGEKFEKAIKPEVVGEYNRVSPHGQLKYVVNGSQQSWDEVDKYTELYRQQGVDWDVYIMGVGATKEEQEQQLMADIAVEAMKRGYYFSGRLHCHIFGNKIGT